jgi:high-affinity K+ transport system ATPase subunit B
VPVEDVTVGDVVIGRSEENIPKDGTVVDDEKPVTQTSITSESAVTLTSITGESVPVERGSTHVESDIAFVIECPCHRW